MIRCGTICSSRSQNLTPSTQILLTLWLQVMYHQGRTNGSLSMKVVSTYGMNHTSSGSALMAYSEGVYRWKKASRSSSDATHHHMADIMVHPRSFKNLAKWILLANHVWRHERLHPKVWSMSEAQKYQFKRCHATHQQPLDQVLWCLGYRLHGTISKVEELWVHLGGNWLCLQVVWSHAMYSCWCKELQ